MFCPKCGSRLPDGAAFCGKCGTKLSLGRVSKSSTDATDSVVHESRSDVTQPSVRSYQQPSPSKTENATRPVPPQPFSIPTSRPSMPSSPQPKPTSSHTQNSSEFDEKRVAAVSVVKGILPDFGPNWQERLAEGFRAAFKAPVPVQTDLPLKWYKYLVWLGLYANALYNLYTLIRATTSRGIVSIIGNAAASIFLPWYSKPLLILSFIGYAVMAAFAIYTRGRLSEFRRDAPQAMLFFYVGMFIIGLFEGLAVCVGGIATQAGLISILIQGITFGVAYALNKKYFDRRAELFIN